jgi:hypothetical protein
LSLDGSISKQSIPTVVSAITTTIPDPLSNTSVPLNPNVTTAPYQSQQQVFNTQTSNAGFVNVPVISNIQPAQTVGAYDVNGNFVLVTAPIIPNVNIQQTAQPTPQQPTTTMLQSSNGGSQPPQQTSHQPSAATPEVKKQQKPASIPKAPRPPENIAASRPSIGSIGGRIFGTAGVGKVLHHLESVRLEVIEADKSLASLQSENRILVSFNSAHEHMY